MDSLMQMRVGKVVHDVEVWNIITDIPRIIRRGIEYKASLIKTEVEGDGKKGMRIVAYWKVHGDHPRGGQKKAPVVQLKRIK